YCRYPPLLSLCPPSFPYTTLFRSIFLMPLTRSAATVWTMALPDPAVSPASGQWFAPTHWSVVLSARGSLNSASKAALERLCRERSEEQTSELQSLAYIV